MYNNCTVPRWDESDVGLCSAVELPTQHNLSMPIRLPAPRLPASPPPSLNSFALSPQLVRPQIASFATPHLDTSAGSTRPHDRHEPVPPDDTPSHLYVDPKPVDERLNLQHDETLVPRSYIDAVKGPAPQIASASFFLYDFSERLSKQCHIEPGPQEKTVACLPSPFAIHMMLGNVTAVRGKLKEIKDLVEFAGWNTVKEARASCAAATSGSAKCGSGEDTGAGAEAVEAGGDGCVSGAVKSPGSDLGSGSGKKKKRKGGSVQGGRIKVHIFSALLTVGSPFF
ncbi:hypothetical protein B0T14DRAFT_84660 [Immersiella caudata]|uniref:Uncharacterized protein n=1 Tax=Immersiella caudata TaxID=314043 RepID=A0AA39XHV2_9PEZI|nr:hypothetical protein B0T14DRAFT_84660 [Immersiella caudata]